MNMRNALLAATIVAAPLGLASFASAQPVTGPYVAGGFGFNIENSQKAKDFTVNRIGVPGSAKIVDHNGYTGEASVGYGFGNGFRVELEGDAIHNNLDKVKAFGTATRLGGGETRYGVFVNGLFDFDIGLPYLYPYVGAGIGWQEAAFDNASAGGVTFNKTRGALAYQGIVGIAVPIAAVPGLSGTLEYRYVALANSRKYTTGYQGVPISAKVGRESNNQILVGLRYQLFTPQPVAPAPAPAPTPVAAPAAAAKTYLVFFDWDKYNLTSRATQIISQAAADSHNQSVTKLDVSGYTDTSGTAQYNQGLSERRAHAVAAQLVSDGVPQNEIEIHAFGETHLLVPTGPGVREPQNRRVEIVIN